MRASDELYASLETWLNQSYSWRDRRHLQVLICMVRALLYSGSVNLTKWSTYLPNRGQYAQSQQRRLSRWLKNPNIVISELYSGLIKTALQDWQQPVMYLSLDSSMLWNEYCLIRLVVVHRGRGLTLAWRVLKHASSTVAYEDYKGLLVQAAKRVPPKTAVVVLADRGFVQSELMQAVDALGWGLSYSPEGEQLDQALWSRLVSAPRLPSLSWRSHDAAYGSIAQRNTTRPGSYCFSPPP